MMLCLDTSALIRLYVEEAHSDAVRAGVDRAEGVASDAVAYTEARATLGRAGDMVELLALRGYDSVHLAAAQFARARSGIPVISACFDDALNRATRALGCDLLPLASG